MAEKRFTDAELIEGCLAGRSQFQFALYKQFSRLMFSICLRYTPNTLQAEDLLQMGFVKVFKHLDSFRGGSLEGWMKKIFVRESINQYHQNLRDKTDYVDQYPDSATSGFEDAFSQLSYQDILRAIDSLPAGCRLVFSLYAIEGYAHAEIAEMLSLSESTSKSQYARAKSLLKSKILEPKNH